MNIWKNIRPYLSDLTRLMRIAYVEAKSTHAGSYLGMAWIPLSSLIFAGMLSLVFHQSHTMQPADFFLYVMSGQILWIFISSSIGGSTDIIQRKLEFAIHNNMTLGDLFVKILADRLFEYAINLAGFLVVLIIVRPGNLGPDLVLIFPFLVLLIVTSLAVSYVVNIVTIFFNDLQNLIKVAVRFIFFASPIFWAPGNGGNGIRQALLTYNPVSYYLGMARQVFDIQPFESSTWIYASFITASLLIFGFAVFRATSSFVRNIK